MSDRSPSLGALTVRGFGWLGGQTLISKLITLGSQVVLAALLLPEDFGDVAIVLGIGAFAALLRTGGVSQVLIRRQSDFATWITPAFWMSVAQGLLSGMVLVGVAPIVGRLFDDSSLVGLMYLLAAEAPLAAMAAMARASLQVRLRFRAIAVVDFVGALAMALLAIGFAFGGLGAASLILPRPIVAGLQFVSLWLIGRPPVELRPRFRLWSSLLGDSVSVLVAMAAYTVTQQLDYVVLGLVRSATEVGLYYFAYNLAMQAIALITGKLQVLLLPALSRLEGDEGRQVNAAIRTTRLLGAVTVPLYCAVALGAAPLIALLFEDRWLGAAPLLSLLSIGMIWRSLSPVSGVLIQSARSFQTYMRTHLASALLFVVMLIPGAYLGGAPGTALVVLLHGMASFTLFVRVGVVDRRELSRLAADLRRIGTAALAGVAAGAVPVIVITNQSALGILFQLLATVFAFAVAYWVALRKVAPSVIEESRSLLKQAMS